MVSHYFNYLVLLSFLLLPFHGAEAETTSFVWIEFPPIPAIQKTTVQSGLTDPFAGTHRNMLLVVGGASYGGKEVPNCQILYSDDVYVLYNYERPDAKWDTTSIKFPYKVAHGVSITTPRGIVCIGGRNDAGELSKVTLMEYDIKTQNISFSELPDLPYTNASMGGALIGDRIYITGGYVNGNPGAKSVFLDLSDEKAGWQTIPDIPGKARVQPIVAAQNEGDETCLFVFGGKNDEAEILTDGYYYIPSQNKWKKIADVAINGNTNVLNGASVMSIGAGHILVAGNTNNLLAYHTITDTWVKAATVPWKPVSNASMVKSKDGFILINGEITPGNQTNEVRGAQIKTQTSFGLLNYAVIFVYLMGMLLIGFYFMKRSSGATDDFFQGGRRIPWWVAGISIFATALSSITFISIPAKAYATDWNMLVFNLAIILVAPIVIRYYLPFFSKLKVASAYQYLEMRFNRSVRFFASALFCIFMITRIAVVLFLPSLALNAVTGINVYSCILMMGLITIAYCTMGGVEAVVWADVIQGFVLVFGALVALVFMIVGTEGGLGGFFSTASEAGKFHTFDFEFNWAQPVFWVTLLGGLANQLITYTSDQSVIQRYLTTKDEKSAARGIWLNGFISIPVSVVFFLIGTGLYTFYKSNPEHLDIAMQNQDAIFPHFMVCELPVGLSGLLIAAVFSAAMSTLSANINSVSTSVTEDFFQQLHHNPTEKNRMRIAHVSGVLVGLLGTGFAIGLATWDIKSLWDQFNVFLGLLTSGLGGLFLMGIFTKRINGTAAMTGVLASIVILLLIRAHTNISFLLFGFIGLVASFIIGWLCSFLVKSRKVLK